MSFLTMLTFSKVIKTLFIWDFQRVAAIEEKTILRCMGLVTLICTTAHLGEEYLSRSSQGLYQFGRWDVLFYLGKVVRSNHSGVMNLGLAYAGGITIPKYL